VTVYGVALELLILIVLVYVPGVQSFMGMSTPLRVSWIPWLGVALILLIYTETLLLHTRSKLRKDALLNQQSAGDTQIDVDVGAEQRVVLLQDGRISKDEQRATRARPGALTSIV